MGGLTLVDPFLLDWAEREPSIRRRAYDMARLQHDISTRLGHHIALNDGFVRRHIQGHAKAGRMPTCNVRCMRCGCSASIHDWRIAATADKPHLHAHWERVRQSHGRLAAYFLEPCQGDVRAEEYLTTLQYMAGESD